LLLPNIHTHSETGFNAEATIINRHCDFDSIPKTGYFSVGLHPWYLNAETAVEDFHQLAQAAFDKNVLAIGECGLDKACSTDWELQKRMFDQQISTAIQVGKPLIIHCVKAYAEVVDMINKHHAETTAVFHGFNKSQQLAVDLIHGGFHLSFGKHLLQENTANVFASLPLNQLFLETDASEIPIETIYQQAAQIKNMSVESVANQMRNNFSTVFGISLNK
jgi:TatD DNase family protein